MQINELDPINPATFASPLGKPNEVGQMCESACVRALRTGANPAWPQAPGETGLLALLGSLTELTCGNGHRRTTSTV